MKNNYNKRRRTVEIYFILYLAALVFLLPDRPNINNGNSNFLNPNEFVLKVHKPVLYCKLFTDSIGTRILSFDSVNTIFYSGKVHDVHFEFTVIDEEQNQKLTLNIEKKSTSENFKIRENPTEKNASFYWKPPFDLRTNKTYLVKVIATAIPESNQDNNNSNIISNTIKKETAFSLSFIYMNNNQPNMTMGRYINGFGANSQEFNPNISLPGEVSQSQGLSLYLTNYQLSAFPYQKWTNKIYVLGMNLEKDLDRVPNIEVYRRPENNKGTAYISSITANEIQISGNTPINGNLNVKLTVVRKSDKKEATVDFYVEPVQINKPEFETVMYPGENYKIDPKFPQILGQELKTIIKDNNRIKVESKQSAKFEFSPDINDTGKVFTLERYANDNLIGQSYQIFIKNYPDPEILLIEKNNSGVARIKTVSYGNYNYKKNMITTLQIEGNGTWKEYYPNTPEQYSKTSHYQYFEITPYYSDRAFEFKVNAIDSRGKKSNQKSFKDK